MELFATDLERLGFLLEAEAELRLAVSGEPVSGELDEDGPSADGADQAQGTSEQATELAADAASGVRGGQEVKRGPV